MKDTVCVWCSAPVKVRDHYNDLQHKALCSQGCRDAEQLFCYLYSDEEAHRRAHYLYLTQGGEDEQERPGEE